jgi:hypothetical protein
MKIEIDGDFMINNSEKINYKNASVNVYTHQGGGKLSHKMSISIESKDEKDVCWITWELNKNQARYLHGFLESFINEKDIDIDAED